ncbi:MAG: STAS domain-containing protein [bacterium]|nr:STAS domain-containing protein [bacterium]
MSNTIRIINNESILIKIDDSLLKEGGMDGENKKVDELFRKAVEKYHFNVELDLSEVTHINAGGIQTLIQFIRSLSGSGRSLAIRDVSEQVDHIFKVTNIFEAIKILGPGGGGNRRARGPGDR